MAKPLVALQLYSLREDCPKDFPGVLKKVAKMGYAGVEFAGYHGLPAAELRNILDDLGLKVAGTHLGVDSLLGAEFRKTLDFNIELGNRYLIIPGLPVDYTSSIDAWKRTAEVFNRIAEQLAPHGMFTGYHNHDTEFKLVEGHKPIEVFLANTESRVCFQADNGNAAHGGGDVVPYIEHFWGRARTVHLKEFAKANPKALIGEGDTDWPRLFKACETVGGTEWYIVEQESYPVTPLESVATCLKNLRGMGRG